MNAVTPVTFTTPDGVTRTLRATLGARKRIAERFNEPNVQSILQKHGDGALPEIAYSLMYDAKGKAPADLSVEEFAENISAEDAMALLSCVMSAFGQGKVSPNEIETLLRAAAEAVGQVKTGSSSGDSESSVSDSPADSSGGVTWNARSMPSPEPTEPQSGGALSL